MEEKDIFTCDKCGCVPCSEFKLLKMKQSGRDEAFKEIADACNLSQDTPVVPQLLYLLGTNSFTALREALEEAITFLQPCPSSERPCGMCDFAKKARAVLEDTK